MTVSFQIESLISSVVLPVHMIALHTITLHVIALP
jgi:hypothetical protein